MNAKKMKKINKHVDVILVTWLKTLVNDEEAAKINLGNYKEMMPTQTHVYNNNKFLLSAFSPKWVKKRIKGLAGKYPERDISSFKLTEVMKESRTWKNSAL